MPLKPIKIGIFASAKTMVEHIKSLAIMDHEIEATISDQGLDEALPVAKNMEASGVEIILARRGTANLLRENLTIPVLAFPQSDLNLILRLKEASEIGKKILLPMFRSKLDPLEDLFTLLQLNVYQKIYEDLASLENIIIEAKQKNYDVVVGGDHSINFAREHGLKTVEIQSSKQNITTTIEDAKSVAISKRIEKERSHKFRAIIDSTSDGIMVIEKNGEISLINKTGSKILNKDDDFFIGQKVSKIISNPKVLKSIEQKKEITDNIELLFNKNLLFNHTPIIIENKPVGGVSTFSDIGSVVKAENKYRKKLSKGLVANYVINDLIHECDEMNELILRCEKFSKTDSTILITGETGTGKEILAQSIHNLSNRNKKPFVSINCAAIPENLLESELFGYEEGAFTGSRKGGKPGLFELAHTGTIFLDEISAASKAVQTRLLRVLQEREVMRIGSDLLIPINVRVIAAANKDLTKEVRENNFREDLFFRINVLTITTPPLRERKGDIPVLAKAFIESISKQHGYKNFEIPQNYLNLLDSYFWPGNVRQLRNFIERLVLLCSSKFNSQIFYEIYDELLKYTINEKQLTDIEFKSKNKSVDIIDEIHNKKNEAEAKIIEKVLKDCHFNKNKAAKVLGMSRTTLWRKLKSFDLE